LLEKAAEEALEAAKAVADAGKSAVKKVFSWFG
jgi:hypothetical protein